MRRALLLSTALLLTACGGGDEDKDRFVSQAKAVCDRATADREALKAPAKPAEFAPYADSLVKIAEQAEQDLAALALPADDREDLQTRVLAPLADLVAEGRTFAADVRAAGADQKALLPLLARVPDSGNVDLEYLRDYGLDACADALSSDG